MKETLKKAFLSLVGAAAITAEKASEIVDELVKKGEITVEEGKKMAKDLKEKGEVAQEEFSKKVKVEVENRMNKLGYIKKEEFEELRQQFDELKVQMDNETVDEEVLEEETE